MESKPNKALDIYKPPFHTDGVFVWSSNDVMSLMVTDGSSAKRSEALLERICDILNSKVEPKGVSQITFLDPEILLDGQPFLIVRGWGHLAGTGGLNLPEDEAVKLQREFALWVVDKLNNNDNK